MTTGKQRMAIGEQFEAVVIDALRARGWYAEPFGQAMLTARMRHYLRETDSHARWMPDVIAARRYAATQRVVYVDAKAGEQWRDTGNHDIETASVQALADWAEFTNCPTFLTFTDGLVTTPDRALTCGRPGKGIGGSGTPFLLVARMSVCMPFDAIFGPLLPRQGTSS